MIDACQGWVPVARKIANATSVTGGTWPIFGQGEPATAVQSQRPLRQLAQARLDMLQWLLFNLCVNNHDAHGKNYSFFVSKAG